MRFDLSARLVWLAVAGLAAGAGAAWVVSTAGPGRPAVPDVPRAVPVAILVGWSFIGSGLLSWYVCGLDWITAQRDPTDPTRPLFEAVNMSAAIRGEGAPLLGRDDAVGQATAIAALYQAADPEPTVVTSC